MLLKRCVLVVMSSQEIVPLLAESPSKQVLGHLNVKMLIVQGSGHIGTLRMDKATE